MLGTGELIIVLIIVVLVFGASKIPALGDGLGRAIRNFKKGVSEDPAIDVTPRPKPPEAPRGDGPRGPDRPA